MLFMAQINLANIAELEPRGVLPPTGILYFFACVWMNAIYPRGSRSSPVWAVRYFDGDPATLRPNVPAPPFPAGVSLNYYWNPERNGVGGYHYKPVAFRFETYLTVPVWYDEFPPHPYLDSLETVNKSEYDSYQNLSYLVPGLAHPVHQMLGWVTEDSRSQLGSDGFEKVMLLQLDSNWHGQGSPSDFRWENSGCAWFLITPEALAKREFETAEFIWATT